jgi:VIT1/CCC1 family predicted Fe2+/Mn2+ transporter
MNDVHTEEHFTAAESIRDIVIGMSDGLTVPFALAAGLSGAVSTCSVIVIAGLAEIAAGSVAMGLGGYLAARTERDHYRSERNREYREVEVVPHRERNEVDEVLANFGVPDHCREQVVDAICADKDRWVDFMMQFELGLSEPASDRALKSGATIAIAYALGGFIPLFPYMILATPLAALKLSIAVTLAALFLFGYGKGLITGLSPLKTATFTLTIGAIAATTAFGIARLVS